jgi:hypothetical protein
MSLELLLDPLLEPLADINNGIGSNPGGGVVSA